MGATWLVGVAINLVGSIFINLGTNVMKLGHNKLAAMPRTPIGAKNTVSKIREWQIGVALFSLGNVGNFVSFGYAAQSLLAAIGCVQFVSNVIFASFVLKEQVSRGVMIATGCIVGGCIMLVSFGSHTSQAYSYHDLLALYGKPAYVTYMSLGAATVVAAYAGYCIGQKTVAIKGAHATWLWSAALPILYSLFSAIVGTQSVLFSKTLAVLLRATVGGDNQLNKWFTWLIVPAFLFTAVFWVTRLNKGLNMFPAMIIVPTLQICWTLFSILSGMLYFQEYSDMKAIHAGMFALGVAVVFVGVFLLTNASAPRQAAASSLPDGATARISFAQESMSDQKWAASAMSAGNPLHGTATDTLRGSAALHPDLDHQASIDEDELSPLTVNKAGVRFDSSSAPVSPAAAAAGVGAGTLQGLQQPEGVEGVASLQAKRSRRLKQAVSSLHKRVASDFNLDEKSAARLSLGLGDSNMPAVSLFAMPMVDLNAGLTMAALLASRYGVVPDRSHGGAAALQASVQEEPDGRATTRINSRSFMDSDGSLSAAAAANIRGLSKTSRAASQPLGAAELAMVGLGPSTDSRGINPLANAIDHWSSSKLPSKAPLSTLINSVEVATKNIKHNLKDFSDTMQTAAEGKLGGRTYARMQSDDDLTPILQAEVKVKDGCDNWW